MLRTTEFYRWLLAPISLLVVVLVSCTPAPERPVRIGMLVWPPYEIFFLARDLGYYDDTPIELVDYGTPAEVFRAYRNGVIDGVAMTSDFLLQIAAFEPGHRAVLVIDESYGGDVLIAKPGFEKTTDLEGRRIGLEMSTLGQFVLNRALQVGGADVSKIELKFADIPDHEQLFMNDDVDAVITYEPVRTKLLKRGGKLLFDSSEIPGEVVDLLFARESVLDEREAGFRALIDGYFRALEYLRQNPEDAASRIASREGITADEYLEALKLVRLPNRTENQQFLGGDDPTLQKSFRRILPLLIENNKVPSDLSTADLLDDRLVR